MPSAEEKLKRPASDCLVEISNQIVVILGRSYVHNSKAHFTHTHSQWQHTSRQIGRVCTHSQQAYAIVWLLCYSKKVFDSVCECNGFVFIWNLVVCKASPLWTITTYISLRKKIEQVTTSVLAYKFFALGRQRIRSLRWLYSNGC